MIELDESAPAPRPWLRWLVYFCVSGGSLAIGAALAVAVLLLGGWRHVPVSRYNVMVILKPEATVEQKNAVRAALSKLTTDDGVILETREQAYARIAKSLKDAGQPLPSGISPKYMPEAFNLSTTGRDFDCSTVAPLHHDPAVSEIVVGMVEGGTGRGARLGC